MRGKGVLRDEVRGPGSTLDTQKLYNNIKYLIYWLMNDPNPGVTPAKGSYPSYP
jgi:hypothetical protein